MSLRRVALTAALTCGTVLLPAAAAGAVEPERSGWWNRLSAGGLVVPQPTAQPGDLRIASGGDAPSAYAAVLYRVPDALTATLDLTVRSTVGTPEVVACPTTGADWEMGENQPYDKAPPFDCERSLAFGSPSEDGKTLSFALDETSQLEPGVWSLALVPQPGSTTGVFSIDVEKPGPASLVVTSSTEPAPFVPSEPSSPDPGTTTSGGSGGSGEAFLPGGFEAPASEPFTGTTGAAPLVAGGEPVQAPASGPAPAVAGGAAPAAGAPLLLARPAGIAEDVGTGRRLLALLVLAGGSAAVGYAAGQQRSGPRLLGGRATAAAGGVPATAVATATATSPAAAAQERPRGIGRFAKDRTEAPRRLR